MNSSLGHGDSGGEALRPAFHFTPPGHWMNDPNGLVFYRGLYHLFYQFHPGSTQWGPMHWGHAVSRDLVHWQDRPIALAPDRHGMIFSGSAVVDWDNTSGLGRDGQVPLLAIFTYHDEAAKSAGDLPQSQALAWSLDGGDSWTKYAGNPVLRPAAGQTDFRDPKVFWHAPSRAWIMVLAAGDHAELYGSPDLVQWHALSSFGAGLGAMGGVWECPDLVPMRVGGRTRWVLILSITPGGPNGGSATCYFVGDFDGRTFTLDREFARSLKASGPRWMDWGRDNYAGVTWSGLPRGDRRTVLIGWMNNWDYAAQTPTTTWRGAMTIARELSLDRVRGAGYVLRSLPVGALQGLAGATVRMGPCRLAGEVDVALPETAVGRSRLDFTLAMPRRRTRVGIALSNLLGDTYRFWYDAAARRFVSDRTQSGAVDFAPGFASVDTAPRLVADRVLRITFIIDRTSVEAFLDRGATAMTTAVFPRAPYTRLCLFTADGPARLLSLRATALADVGRNGSGGTEEAAALR